MTSYVKVQRRERQEAHEPSDVVTDEKTGNIVTADQVPEEEEPVNDAN